MKDGWTTLASVLESSEKALRAGRSAAPRVWPTGFDPLDPYLGGGLRAGELTLLGGPQGLGKTTWALQMMRNMAAAGSAVSYFSFEHDEQTLLERLICIESGERDGIEGLKLRQVRQALESLDDKAGLGQRLSKHAGGADAVKAVSEWAELVNLHRSSGATTSLDVIRASVEGAAKAGSSPVVVVDYLQKVAVPDRDLGEADRVTLIVEGLKDLALQFEVPVLAIVAADREGIVAGKRLRVHHLRGSSALAYEADVVLLLNDKYDVVARHHLVYDVGNAERFRDWAVLTIEKNRTGLDRIDLEFHKRFDQGRFDASGKPVREQLIDERVFVE
ncbi:MAG TPA: DnaB-like helicase C-terminal domain-containing protein [Mycobacteriales bacterium]|nr:DnaB-like helicase C-terminal domain-containing protein [Mycobacteriales bacterium]